MSLLLLEQLNFNNIPILRSDNFHFAQFPYPQSIYWAKKYIHFGKQSYFYHYLNNLKSINYNKNSQLIINEIRKFNQGFLQIFVKNKAVLNFIKKKRQNKKSVLIPLGMYLTPSSNWNEMVTFFIKEIFPKIPSDIDIILTVHESFWKDKKHASYRKVFEQFISQHKNIIYHKKLFCISNCLSQWLIFYVDGIVLGQGIGSVFIQALFYGKEVFYVQKNNTIKYSYHYWKDELAYTHNYSQYPQEIFKLLKNEADISCKNNFNEKIDKIIYILFKNHCYLKGTQNSNLLVDYIETVIQNKKNQAINSDLDLLHNFTPYKYKVLKSGEIKRVGFSYSRLWIYFKKLLKMKIAFYRRYFNLSKNKYWE